MKIYISFGQAHKHKVNGKVFDKDCLCMIECETETVGRDIAFEHFNDVWAFSYTDADIMEFREDMFPRGIIPLKD